MSEDSEGVIIRAVPRRGSSPVLFGRETELEALASAFERVRGHAPGVILVAGDAGIGKSRLVREFTDGLSHDGAVVLSGSCLDLHEEGMPYAPFIEAFRAWMRRTDAAGIDVIAEFAEPLASLLPDRGLGGHATPAGRRSASKQTPDVRLARLYDGVLALLGRLAQDRPVVVVLEDIHWADASTRDLLRFLVRNLRDEPILVVATYRTDELHRRHPVSPLLAELLRADRVERLELRPLDRSAIRDLVATILGEPPGPDVLESLAERSDGLPFYVEELVAAGPTSARLPSTLRDVLGRRLDSLTPVARSLVGAAAVVGRQTTALGLAAVSGLSEDELIEGLRAATEASVLVSEDDGIDTTYTFRHALLREAADDQLVPPERARLHARAADHFERVILDTETSDAGSIADVAGHAFGAHDLPRAIAWSVRAARALAAAAAYRESLIHAERAISLWPQVADAAAITGLQHPDLLELAATAATGSNRPDRAVAHLQAAIAELVRSGNTEPQREAGLQLELWSTAWEAADLPAASAAVERAYALGRDGPVDLRIAVTMALGNARWWNGQLREAARTLQEAITLAETSGELVDRGQAMTFLAHTLVDLGQADAASALIDRSADAIRSEARSYHEVVTWGDRSVTLHSVGRFADGEAAALEGLEVARRYGWEAQIGHYLRACLVDACLEQGRFASVESLAAPVLLGEGVPHTIDWTRLSFARVEIRRGNVEAARELLAGISDTSDPWGAGTYVTLTDVDLARADGRFEDVRRLVDRVASEVGDEAVLPAWQILALGIDAASDVADHGRRRRKSADVAVALDCATGWLEGLRRIVVRARSEGGAGTWAEATLATAEAEVERIGGASDPDRWAGIAERWDAMPHTFSAARARLRLADAMLRAGDRGAAERELVTAFEVASSMGARPLAAEIAALADAARIRLRGAPLDSATDPDESADGAARERFSLTPRERAVLGLVAEGQTNREIGGRLFISEKTVSVHVTNAMAKLGALSRYEAASLAQRLDLLGSDEP